MLRKEDVTRDWYELDLEGKTLGRVATKIAMTLMGKNKVTYTPHVDNGDYVVVTNAKKVAVTGKKLMDKKYYRHSGYIGGLTTKNLSEMLDKKPEDVIKLAVKRMLPKNKLGSQMLTRLKVNAGPEHNNSAQQPKKLEI
ncbi:MAG: 50S ribosomal protein L13 [Fusobacteriota bacterium]